MHTHTHEGGEMANGWNKSGQGFEDWRLSKDRAWRQEQAKRAERDQDQMDRGPYLDQDGYTLIVPSLWYNPTVSAFWKSKGFFDRRILARKIS